MGIFSFLRAEKVKEKIGSSTTPAYQDPPQNDEFKAYIPNFLYKPPFGYPLNKNVLHLKALARNPFIFSVIRTLKDEASTTKWEIKLKKEYASEAFKSPQKDNNLTAVPEAASNDHSSEIKRISDWFYNPNGNDESFNEIIGQWIQDLCEVDAAVGVKVFNKKNEFSQLFARDGGCLDYNTKVETDYGFVSIGKIVKDNMSVNVKSWNINKKEFEFKPVINWFNNSVTTDWLKIKSLTNKKFRSLTVTPVHKIYTPNGYVLAGDLKVGDIVYTQVEQLNNYQKQILLGSLLGDGSLIRGSSEHAKLKFKETHGEKQKDYLLFKKQAFDSLGTCYNEYKSAFSKDYESTLKCEFHTCASMIFEEFYGLKYPSLKSEIVNDLNELGLAIWIQDDGYYTRDKAYEISCGLTDINILNDMCSKLSNKFGFAFEAKKRTRENIIRVDKKNSVILQDLIFPFIHPSMSYKVDNKPCGERLNEINNSLNLELCETEVFSIEQYKKYDTRYDIEVADNHNFFAQGILVSNSFLKNPDIYGYIGNRDEIVYSYRDMNPNLTMPYQIKIYSANYAESAAYYQYGWTGNALPVPFGRREIMYMMANPRTDSIYGRSPLEVIEDVLVTLIYGTAYNTDFYLNGNMPDGMINLVGADTDIAKAFQDRLKDKFKTTDSLLGNSRRVGHQYPVYGGPAASFVPFQISSKDMEIIEQQKWFTKLVWSAFGVTADEMGYCYSSDTRVLTNNGLKYYFELNENDMIATIINDKEIEYIKPSNIYTFDVKDKRFHHYKNNCVDVLVSDDHRILYNTSKNKEWRMLPSNGIKINTVHFLQGGLNWNGKDVDYFEIPFIKYENNKDRNREQQTRFEMNEFCEFMGYYLSEGNIWKKGQINNTYTIKISQTDKNGIKIMNPLMNKMGFRKKKSCWLLNNKSLAIYLSRFGSSIEKFIPQSLKDLSKDKIKILFDALIVGDGTKNMGENSFRYGSSSKQLAADVLELSLKLGYKASITVNEYENKNWNTFYSINGNKFQIEPRIVISRQRKNELYTGVMWCPSVQNRPFITERNGKIGIHYNTEDSNKAVSQTQTAVHKRKALKPMLKKIEYMINNQLMTELDSSGKLEFAFEDYDVDEELKKAQLYQQQITGGWKTAEMVAEEEGIDMNKLKVHKEEEAKQEMEMAKETNPGFMPEPKVKALTFTDQLEKGMKVEMEHTDNPEIAKKIATDHLQENIAYYVYLDEMEKKMKKDSQDKYKTGDIVKIMSASNSHIGKMGKIGRIFNNGKEEYYEVILADGNDVLFSENLKKIRDANFSFSNDLVKDEELAPLLEPKVKADKDDTITDYFEKVRAHLIEQIEKDGTQTQSDNI